MKNKMAKITLAFIVAIITVFLVFIEGRIISKYLVGQNNDVLLSFISIVSGMLVFVSVWNNLEKRTILFLRYIMSIVLSFFVIVLIGILFGICVSLNLFDSLFNKEFLALLNSSTGAVFVNFLFSVYVIVVVVMGVILFLVTRKKIQYIEYISKEIKVMEQKGLDHELVVKGNDELSELSKSINNMANTLLTKEKLERELITNISHDLRNPMTSILGYVDLLKQNGVNDSDKFCEYIEVVDRRLHELKEMIDELFELSKLSENGGKLRVQEQDVIILLKQIAQENEFAFRENELKLECFIPKQTVLMRIDAEKIARAMQNIFDNARKYAVRNTIVRFDVEILENQIVIAVLNQFDTVQSIDIDLLFERFYKADEARSNTDSNGLGLAIVKKIIQLHGGKVEAKVLEDNICFKLYLPIKRND